jgi:hypothetical protein
MTEPLSQQGARKTVFLVDHDVERGTCWNRHGCRNNG